MEKKKKKKKKKKNSHKPISTLTHTRIPNQLITTCHDHLQRNVGNSYSDSGRIRSQNAAVFVTRVQIHDTHIKTPSYIIYTSTTAASYIIYYSIQLSLQ